MPFKIFGFTIRRTADEKEKQNVDSFVLPETEDGAVTVQGVAGAYGAYVDFDATIKNEFDLITRYRDMSLLPDVDSAIDDIVNELIVQDDNKPPVALDVSRVPSEEVRKNIEDEYENILELLDWKNQAYEIAKKWYVDGRLNFHLIIDPQRPGRGILDLRYIDPRQIRKVRQIENELDSDTGTELVKVVDEYFVFHQRGMNYNTHTAPSSVGLIEGTRISVDSICYIHSGVVDKYSASILSHLHKGIKPINQLKMMEDAMVIYRIARAPERRIFYVDVGNLPKAKADDYLRSIMERYRNKLSYNIETGEIRDDRRFLSMLEDYWLPRREGSQGTSIDTLPGGENLGEMQDVEYFQKKVYQALNVPISRMDPHNGFQLGRTTEITRDEIKFSKFITRLRIRFSHLFNELLHKQLILKKIISPNEWPTICQQIRYDYRNDNYFAELKNGEVLRERLTLIDQIDPYINKYFSVEWVRENVLKQSLDDQKQIDMAINKSQSKDGNKLDLDIDPDGTNPDSFMIHPSLDNEKKMDNQSSNGINNTNEDEEETNDENE